LSRILPLYPDMRKAVEKRIIHVAKNLEGVKEADQGENRTGNR